MTNKKQVRGILQVVCFVLFFIMLGTCVFTMLQDDKGVNDVTSESVEAAVIFGSMFLLVICGGALVWNTDTKKWSQAYHEARKKD